MIIIGIDPGYDRCGFAVLKKAGSILNLLDFGIIKTDKDDDFQVRQAEIADDFQSLLTKYKPDTLSIEDLFFAKNVTTGLKVAQVRGVLTYLATKANCDVIEPKPVEIKSHFCGDGKADKAAMKQMAQMTFGLKQSPQIDDAADAIAVAHFAAFRIHEE